MANKSQDKNAPISLPKGGGAIKGIGETFQPNLFSGTDNFSVPIFTSHGRDGFGPKLTLQYSTGKGNGFFGLGWQLSIPRITRKTEKGLPTYRDEDVFVMSGAEDLVPYLERVSDDPDRWEPVLEEQDEFTIHLYRPRTEGQFARIEKLTRTTQGEDNLEQKQDIHWRATTKENVTGIYGRTPAARITHPDKSDRVFEWLLEETFDARGNHILYEYIHENADLTLPGIHEHNRSYTQIYIRRILYGNTPDNLDPELRAGPTRIATDHTDHLKTRERHYVFEVLFDYGEFDKEDNAFPPDIPREVALDAEERIPHGWPVREDPFSNFRAGFEIRTLRRCNRVLMLHHFKEGEPDGAPLVKSTDFEYQLNPDTRLSLLSSVTVLGYRKDPNNTQAYLKRDMPPVSFEYSKFEPHTQRYQSVSANGNDLPAQGLNAPDLTLMDVFGNGLTDILQSSDAGFYFWQNFGQGHFDRRRAQPGGQPAVSFAQGNVSFGDLAGDGLADLVVDAPPMSGFYESTPGGGWRTFKRFETMPSFALNNPNTRVVDLTGDGLSDVLVTRDDRFLWFRCKGEAGYDGPIAISRRHDLDAFPDVYFGDPAGRVRLADMSGDGLNDIVLVHDGRIDYWPNLGYGQFGRRIITANTPRIGFGFDPRRMFLVDLDRTGCADLIYVESGSVRFWFNQFCNEWSSQETIHGTPHVTDLTAVQFTDFYDTGVYFDPDRFIDHENFEQEIQSEFYRDDPKAFALKEHLFKDVSGNESLGETPHEVFRALRGAILRTEVYGRDDSTQSDNPYLAIENRYLVKALQPKNGNNHGVFLTLPKESLSYHYERNPADPRISHTITFGMDKFGNLTDGVDDFGNVTDSVAIGYPRRTASEDMPEQGQFQVVYTRSDFINKYSPSSSTTPAYYYAGIPCQIRAYEISGIDLQFDGRILDEQIFKNILETSIVVDPESFLPYEAQRDESAAGLQRRIIEWTRSYFRKDADPDQIAPIGNLNHRLPLGEIESLALPCESCQAAFTNTMLQKIFGDRINGIDVAEEGGYHPLPDHAAAEGDGGIQDYKWIPSGRQGFDSKKFFQGDHAQDSFGHVSSTESDAYALLIELARDALPPPHTNLISAKNDYRVLQAFEVTDPNGNRSQVAFDALGLVVGTVLMSEDAEGNAVGDSLEGFVADLAEDLRNSHIHDPLNMDDAHDTNGHNSLKGATSRLVYDLKRFDESGQPNVIYTLARETHASDEKGTPSKIQHAFVYSDGFGRESQTKVQAEPDPSDPNKPRWASTGTTIYINKGKAVQQFEPFFSDDHLHGIERHGVSPILFYDPLKRVVATLHPNHTYEKVVFNPWQQITYDVKDTIAFDPETDDDVRGFFISPDGTPRIPTREFLPTWNQLRTDPLHEAEFERHYPNDTDRSNQTNAAIKAAIHADTPTTAHIDTLGCPFLTVAHNKFKRTDADTDDSPIEKFYRTRVVFDIEGNQREVIDAMDRIVMTYDYDMLGNRLHQARMEAGERWMLNDVIGQSIRAWDSRGHVFRNEYDPLRRPLCSFVTGANIAIPNQEILTERMIYGEQHPRAEQMNLHDVLYFHLDQAGRTATEKLDFKGNPLHTARSVATKFKQTIDWQAVDAALPVEVGPPLDLHELEVAVGPQLEGKPYTSLTTYDAKGQRLRIEYKNGATTHFDYEPDTFRLVHLYTRRGATFTDDCGNDPPFAAPANPPPNAPCGLQNLHYTYDPDGNITQIRNEAQKIIFFRNKRVEPSNDYTYDAIYRLIEAKGRVHLGQAGSPISHSYNDAGRTGIDSSANDGNVMGTYTERYVYDAVGNFLQMQHRGREPEHNGWTREYNYEEASLIEPDKKSNRLSSTTVVGTQEIYSTNGDGYDEHGNMLKMPQLHIMEWDFEDQLRFTQRQKVNEEDEEGIERHGERTFYVYDAGRSAGAQVDRVGQRQFER